MDQVPKDTPVMPTYTVQNEDEDAESVDEGQYDNSRCSDTAFEQTEEPVIRAKSARELVKNQEHLLDLLHNMKSDLAKMDREASAIKEDIVRSNQLFHVMVKMGKTHHLGVVPGGYNISHALPRVTYQRHRSAGGELKMKHLNQLSTYRPNLLSDGLGGSSFSSRYSTDYDESSRSGALSSVNFGSRRSSERSNLSDSSTDGSYSGNSATESEIDSATPLSYPRIRITRNTSRDYSSGTSDEAGSSTESVSTLGRYPAELNLQNHANRRSSYFYTARVETPPQVQSDEIDL